MSSLARHSKRAREAIERNRRRPRTGVQFDVTALHPERLEGIYRRVADDTASGWAVLAGARPATAPARVEYAAAARLLAELALDAGARPRAAPLVADRLLGWVLGDPPAGWHAQHDTHAAWTAWLGVLEVCEPPRGEPAARLVEAGAAPAASARRLRLSAWRAALERLARAWPSLAAATAGGTGEVRAWVDALCAQWAHLVNHAYGTATGILDDEAWAGRTTVPRDPPHAPFEAVVVRPGADEEAMWTLRSMQLELGRLDAWLRGRRVRRAAPLPAAARAAFERWARLEGAPYGVFEEVRERARAAYFHRYRRPGARHVAWLRDVRDGTLAGETVRARSRNAIAAEREWQRDVALLAPDEYSAFCERYARAPLADLLRRRADAPFGPTFWALVLWELWGYTLAIHTRVLWHDVAAYEPPPDILEGPRVAVWGGCVYVTDGGDAWLHADVAAAVEQWSRLRAARAGLVEREALADLRADAFERGVYRFSPVLRPRDVYAEDRELAEIPAAVPPY